MILLRVFGKGLLYLHPLRICIVRCIKCKFGKAHEVMHSRKNVRLSNKIITEGFIITSKCVINVDRNRGNERTRTEKSQIQRW